MSSMSGDDCELPGIVRSNMINLGMFTFNRTIQMAINPRPQQLSALIDINRNIAMGLRGNGADTATPSAA